MSSIEERRAGMIETSTGSFIGTLESANRQRIEQLKHSNFPDIRYFTLEEQQNFIQNHPVSYLDEDNPLERVQRRFSEEFNTPLFIPYKNSYDQKWTYQQLEALAMQGVSVSMKYEDSEGRPANSSTGFPVFPYAYSLKGSAGRPRKGYYERFLTTELPDPRIYSGTPTISGTSPISEEVKESGRHRIIPRGAKMGGDVFLGVKPYDPSTSAGYRTNTLKYGYEEPEPQVEKDCPIYCDIVYVPTNTVAYSGLCSCSMLENYQNDPDYRIDQISKRETKPDYRDTQPEPEKLYTVYGQTLPLSQSAVDYYESLGVAVTTAEIDPYVPPTEKPFEKPDRDVVFKEQEPEITTDHIEPPIEEQDFIPPTSQVDPPVEEEPEITTDHVAPPGVEEPAVTTSQVEPPSQEVTAEISWFGDTWFPWHLELEDRRRR